MTILFYLLAAALCLVVLLLGCLVFTTRRLARKAGRMVPPSGRFIEADGTRFHYSDVGEGPPIVLVHGLGGTLHHFPPALIARLARHHRVIALDRSGAGYSTRRPDRDGRLPDQAAEIKAFIDALGIEKPLIVGHSLGGMIALTLGVEHPADVAGVALISPLTRGFRAPPASVAGLNIPSRAKRRLIAETIAVPIGARTADATMAFIFAPQKPTQDYMTAGGGWLGLRPDQFFAVAGDFTSTAIDIERISARYGELKMPVGLLVGDADQVLDFTQQSLPMREDVAGIDLEILPGVGHMPQFVEPERTADFILRMAGKAIGVPAH
ncbi:MAG: alpha/beta hydrolase [Mesorhizobium sp.]